MNSEFYFLNSIFIFSFATNIDKVLYMKSFFTLLCMLFFGYCLRSCSSFQEHSEIPEIHFKQLIFEDRLNLLGQMTPHAVITFSFIDGDGDIGVRPQEESITDITLVSRMEFIWYKILLGKPEPYQFEKGIITPIRIPYNSVMDRTGAQNKILKGTIEAPLDIPGEIQGIDTMFIEFYIFDRKLNKSNVERTPNFSVQNKIVLP